MARLPCVPDSAVPETRPCLQFRDVGHSSDMTSRVQGPAASACDRSVLVVRSDNEGDVLLAGPAIRAVAAQARVTLLCGSRGYQAARLLPGVDRVLVRDLPWIDLEPRPVTRQWMSSLVDDLAELQCHEAIILTSFHQSPLPLAMLLRAAGVQRITAICEDYPGALLDVRLTPVPNEHEVERGLRTARAAGFPLPAGDDGLLHLKDEITAGVVRSDTVIVHPGASVSTRGIPAKLARRTVKALCAAGITVTVTGSANESGLTRFVAGDEAQDLGGRTRDIAQLAQVVAGAGAIIVGNTGPAHLASSVRTPVVSVFSPVVPWESWRPFGVATTRFGDSAAACAGTRSRSCPIPDHPCVSLLDPQDLACAARNHLNMVTGRGEAWNSARSMS
jgi:ADP-heptose:LPS heptosyltransferase